jgi:hypothetical protein
MFNSIFEERQRQEDNYHISLTMPRDQYISIYGKDVNNRNAEDIVNQYLQYKEDDGRPEGVVIYDYPGTGIVNIEADLQYVGNDHTDYINDLQ